MADVRQETVRKIECLTHSHDDEQRRNFVSYYFHKQFQNTLPYHVEAIHGTPAPELLIPWLETLPKKRSVYERHTNDITSKASNHIVTKHCKVIYNLNALTENHQETWIWKNHIGFDNLGIVVAHRWLWKERFHTLGILEENGSITSSYMVIQLHGMRSDHNGSDIALAARDGLLDEKVTVWSVEKLTYLMRKCGITNAQGKTPEITIQRRGKYNGSHALMRAKWGDELIDQHSGFGAHLQPLQLELSPFIREKYHEELGVVFDSLGREFILYDS